MPADTGERSPGGALPLGVLLAGGESRRFGASKALVQVGGRPMAAWGRRALEAHLPKVVAIANDGRVGTLLGVESRPDLHPATGPLGGLHTGLSWAAEEGFPAVFLLACDMPLVSPEVVEVLLGRGEAGVGEGGTADVVTLPASEGPIGGEPLCAIYPVDALETVERRIVEGALAMEDLLRELPTREVPAQALSAVGDPATLFMNVNRPAERTAAERIIARAGGEPPFEGGRGGAPTRGGARPARRSQG